MADHAQRSVAAALPSAPVQLVVVGGGPAGLLFAYLVKRRFPAWRVELHDQNAADATFGFGVVFSEGALSFLERDAPELAARLLTRMERWPIQRIVHRDDAVDIDGAGFSAIARLALNRMLQRLCDEVGVRIAFASRIAQLPEADLVVGADGAQSFVREALRERFQPRVQWLANRFVWYGTTRVFDCLTLTFRENADGAFVAHHYRYSPTMSTFIVECDAQTFQRVGFEAMDDAASRAYCERVFAPELAGHPLVSNRSVWRRFPILANERWSAGRVVLIGDALRTMHFSIGSGTRLAFEDAIALDRALGETGGDVERALVRYEQVRRPVVEKLFAAATRSSHWYEEFPARMRRLDALGLAYHYMTRTGRMDDARLREQSPRFMARVEAARQAGR